MCILGVFFWGVKIFAQKIWPLNNVRFLSANFECLIKISEQITRCLILGKCAVEASHARKHAKLFVHMDSIYGFNFKDHWCCELNFNNGTLPMKSYMLPKRSIIFFCDIQLWKRCEIIFCNIKSPFVFFFVLDHF